MQAACKNHSRGAASSPGTPRGPVGPAGPGGPGGPGRAIVDEPSETQMHTLAHIHIYTHIQQTSNKSILKDSYNYSICIFPNTGSPSTGLTHSQDEFRRHDKNQRESSKNRHVWTLTALHTSTYDFSWSSRFSYEKRQKMNLFSGEDLSLAQWHCLIKHVSSVPFALDLLSKKS